MDWDMDEFDYWRLCDELSVIHAALLIVGENPSSEDGKNCEVNTYLPAITFKHGEYFAAKTALQNAIKSGRLKATIRRDARLQGWDEFPNVGEGVRALYPDEPDSHVGVIYCETPNWHETTVLVDDLRVWLKERGLSRGFFFPNEGDNDVPAYLDKKHPRFSQKLAAAINAWLAVDDPNGKSPKSALMTWLNQNANTFAITDDDGLPIKQAVEDIAKVANWDGKGGAPKTPIR